MKSIQFNVNKLLGYRIALPGAMLGNKKASKLGSVQGPKLGNKRGDKLGAKLGPKLGKKN